MPTSDASGWWIVVPVKGTDLGKSRLATQWPGDIRALARAFALDVIEAASEARMVAGVVVVTTRDEAELLRDGLGAAAGAVRFVEDPNEGLNPAIAAGVALARADEDVPVAALLGDLPALRAADLTDALLGAGDAPASFVPDVQGTGTTLVTAARGVPFRSAFGSGSALRHRDLGLREVQRDRPGIRHDVDTLADLRALAEVGRHTRALLAALEG